MGSASQQSLEHTRIISVVDTALKHIDPRLINHGERVAYIATTLCLYGKLEGRIDLKKLLFLSLFHDIGAFKTEEIEKMMEFENDNVWNHAIYSYLFLKNITSLGESAQAVLHHHTPYSALDHHSPWTPYAALLFFADRVDLSVQSNTLEQLFTLRVGTLSPELCTIFEQANHNNALIAPLQNGTYQAKLYSVLHRLEYSQEQVLEYLKLLVFSIDFRSPYTVTHTINTTAISQQIGRLMGFSQLHLAELAFGAFLHDIGKIGIPFEILEHPGRLSAAQMEVMKTHAVITEEILQVTVPARICRIAARHHEKLDGSGYPHGLTEKELTVSERIVAIADIISALTCQRSYKQSFPKEKTLEILLSMRDDGKICPAVCEVVLQHYDEIMRITDASQDPVIQMYNSISEEYQKLCATFSAEPFYSTC